MRRRHNELINAPDMQEVLSNPLAVSRELNNRSLFHFIEYFWDEVSTQSFKPNWHIEYLCQELEKLAERVGNRQMRLYDLLINVPPGTTKTITCSIMFPAWCWTKWYWMRFITASYSLALALESAEYCRDLVRSERFRELYPDIDIREDKDTKGNFKIVRKQVTAGKVSLVNGGNRYSTSVGGTLTGFHGDILIWDDPLNPNKTTSEKEIATANRWIDETLPTRKTDKECSVTIGIMQRLHQDDPTGHLLNKKKANIRHICLPGEIRAYAERVNPPELASNYRDDLLDPRRLSWAVLKDLEADLGVYGYAGQIGQDPTPPGGGMFKVEHFQIESYPPKPNQIVRCVRYWDKAGTADAGAYTVGVKIAQLRDGRWFILDVKRGQWGAEHRERIIKETAYADGVRVYVYVEQEPGSGGKESAEATIRNLAGFACYADRPTGDKVYRADAYAVQVNNGMISLLNAAWNVLFIEEHRYFPFGKYKDQVDASAAGWNQLVKRKEVRRIT
jgi:predicted phage terminase large subunit-like protein